MVAGGMGALGVFNTTETMDANSKWAEVGTSNYNLVLGSGGSHLRRSGALVNVGRFQTRLLNDLLIIL